MTATLHHSFANSLREISAAQSVKRVAAAVSGGSDSMALLCLLSGWCRRSEVELAAVSVDHGIRPAARNECDLVAGLARKLGHEHRILRWQPVDGGNLQNEARRGRYRLIAGWAREAGIEAVLLGHTMDDQAETLLLNLARGSGVDGLAAMPSAIERDGMLWLRPLLTFRRHALRKFLCDRGVSWVEDPSNDDDRFDRVKLRRMIPELASLGMSVERLSATAGRMQLARQALEQATEEAARHCACLTELGEVRFSGELWSLSTELRLRLVSDALRAVSVSTYRPRLHSLVNALESARLRVVTLSGCMMLPMPGNGMLVMREHAACGPPVSADALWDKRWLLDAPGIPDGSMIAALGKAGLKELGCHPAADLSPERLSVTPSLWLRGRLYAAPFAGLRSGIRFRLENSSVKWLGSARRH
ncbi:MAG: tRNA lysidine(34) synthetase TilS [Rhodobacteraceae bacterium]|nr:tRNA lysidine(34) synthetase TilS [Paracoccaceae bacterium]